MKLIWFSSAWTVTSKAEEGNQREKAVLDELFGITPRAIDVCPYNTYSVPKITSQHLITMINGDQNKSTSIPVLKQTHLWGEIW